MSLQVSNLFIQACFVLQVKRKHDTAEGYFAEVGQEKVRRLYEIFRLDFEMFGYTAEGFLTPPVMEENRPPANGG